MRDSWRKQVRAFFRACLKSAQALDFTRDNQIFVVAQRDAMLGCETLRTFGHKVHVRTVAQDFASGPDRIAQPLYTADAACSQRGAIHDEGIELHFAFAIEKAAATGIESLIVFHDDYSFLDGIERRATAFKHTPARRHGVADAVEMRF